MKRVLSLVLACMVLMSTVAFAAEPATYVPESDGTYSISYTEGTANSYYALFAVEGIIEDGEAPVISEETVYYIDQGTADANGDVTFNGWVPKKDGKATVYLGGSDLEAPVLLGYLSAAKRTITGTVSEVPATAYEATVTLTDSEGEYTATTVNGAYTLQAPDGAYTLKVNVENYLEKTVSLIVAADTTENVTLLGGDVNADGAINGADITKLIGDGNYDTECDIDGDGTVDYDDLMVVLNNYSKTEPSEEAATSPTVTYDLEEVGSGVYKVTATLTDEEDDFRGWKNEITYDSNVITPVADSFVAYSGASFVKAATVTESGANSKISFETYVTPGSKDATGVTVFEMQFTLVDGKTTEDFTSETFKVDYIAYSNGNANYYGTTKDNISVVNNVVPNATVITIPVTAGDKIYLQNGETAIASETGDYQVPNRVGYVAVNTGKESQKTYYIDAKTATQVHTNGVVAYEEFSIRGPLEVYQGEERKGLRFGKLGHNPLSRTVADHEVTEVGVLMTTESSKVLGFIDSADNLTWEMVAAYPAYVKYGYALGNGYNRFMNSEKDDLHIFSAVMYNIPLTEKNVQTNIVCRPFYKVGDTYIYGETLKATLFDVATEVAASEVFEDYDEELKAYINEIIALVDLGTDIEDDEVIIDIGSLYGN